jgi:hypothetical protein
MPLKTTSLKACPTIGIDIGKNTFHLIGLDKMGAIVLRQVRNLDAPLAPLAPPFARAVVAAMTAMRKRNTDSASTNLARRHGLVGPIST